MYGYVQRSKLINSNAFTTHFPLGMCMTWGTCDKPIAHATLVSKPQHPKDPGPLFRKEHEIPTVMMAAFQQPGEAQKDSKRSSSVINISAKLYIYIYVFFGGCYYNAFHLFWDHSGSEFGTPNWAPNAPTTGRPPVKKLQTLATHKVSATVLQS